MKNKITDPVELVIADALYFAGIKYIHETNDPDGLCKNLDFYIPAYGAHIECKRMHTERTCGQMKRSENIIVIQGMEAAYMFADMLAGNV